MTDAERLEEIRAKLHGGSQVTADEIVFLESEHGKTVLSYHKALEERWAEIVELRAEVERLRGVVEAATAESAFEAWWNSDIPTPPMPEIDLYPTSPFTPRRIYFGPNNRGTAWAAWQAALADLEAKP